MSNKPLKIINFIVFMESNKTIWGYSNVDHNKPEKDVIRTSKVVSCYEEDGIFFVETLNSIYKCPISNEDNYERFERNKKEIKDFCLKLQTV